MTATWKAILRVPAAQADPLAAALEESLAIETGGVLAFEDPGGKTWTVEAILLEEPQAGVLEALLAHAQVSSDRIDVERLPDIDWVAKSLADLPPIRARRFFICGAHDRSRAPPNAIVLQIEANQAFGTGSHPTTRGCLLTLTALAKQTRAPKRLLDLGCGSGILAFAMAHLWASPRADIVRGVDIDPISVATARDNARINALHTRVRLVTGNGLAHPDIRDGAPYDLIVANILAGPLTHLAPEIAASLKSGGRLILSGLLASQEVLVRNRYRAHGFRLESRLVIDGWTTLTLTATASG